MDHLLVERAAMGPIETTVDKEIYPHMFRWSCCDVSAEKTVCQRVEHFPKRTVQGDTTIDAKHQKP